MDGAVLDPFSEPHHELVNGVGQLVLFVDLEGLEHRAHRRGDRSHSLANLGWVLGHELAGHIAQCLRAAECLFELKDLPVPEPFPETGHDRDVRAGESIDRLPVVTYGE
ncbi:hypothetical protein D9M69_389420 [compost metagenome]